MEEEGRDDGEERKEKREEGEKMSAGGTPRDDGHRYTHTHTQTLKTNIQQDSELSFCQLAIDDEECVCVCVGCGRGGGQKGGSDVMSRAGRFTWKPNRKTRIIERCCSLTANQPSACRQEDRK